MTTILKIDNLHVQVEETKILKGVNLNIQAGEIHVIMGTNGAGKSTLAASIMGHPKYKVNKGKMVFNNQNLLKMQVDERARAGIFLAMQNPSEIIGISNFQFLKRASLAKKGKSMPLEEFNNNFEKKSHLMKIPPSWASRSVNEGYSGGEKKKNEVFQMLLLEPKLVILDEIDSGLDLDAIKMVGENITNYYESQKERVALLIITHYPKILEYIKPDFVHILHEGKIIKTGDYKLIYELESNGYEKASKK